MTTTMPSEKEVKALVIGYKLCRRCFRSIWIAGCKECVYCGAQLEEPHVINSMEVTNIRFVAPHIIQCDVSVTLLPAPEHIALDMNAMVTIGPAGPEGGASPGASDCGDKSSR